MKFREGERENGNITMAAWKCSVRENQFANLLNYRDICMKMAFPCSRQSIKIAPVHNDIVDAEARCHNKFYQIDACIQNVV